jgi:hypothetical protein|tara:strand:+ start:322 stop:594 length:273 start_codon:yes stop_codon:yes gene_type:complete
MSQLLDNKQQIKLAVMANDVSYIKGAVDKLEKNQNKHIELIKSEYAKKIELENLEERVESFEKLRDWAGKVILGVLILGILALLGFQIGG